MAVERANHLGEFIMLADLLTVALSFEKRGSDLRQLLLARHIIPMA
jgi:hypothetical protein